MKSKLFFVNFCLLLAGISCATASDINIYVSPQGSDTWSGRLPDPTPNQTDGPLATIEKAKDRVRQLIAAGTAGVIRVQLRGGRYELAGSPVFTPEDSGSEKRRVIYQAFEDEKPVLSGGRRITGWTRASDNLWSVHLPDVLEGKWHFRQLFADDARLMRSRYPNPGEPFFFIKNIKEDKSMLSVNNEYTLDREIPFANLGDRDVEVVALHFWSISRHRIKSTENDILRTNFFIGWDGHTLTEANEQSRVYFEHAKEFIDLDGEWYLDRDTGDLFLQSETNPNEQTIVAPRIEQLITVRGTKDRPVRHLEFRGITFAHAAWHLPLMGYNGTQAACYGARYVDDATFMLPAAVLAEFARDCTFEMCRFRHTGASGLAFGAGCRDNRILGCEFFDIGGNALVCGFRERDNDPPRRFFENDWPDPEDAPQRNTFSDNYIHECAVVQFGGVGYFELFSQDTVFSHNLIEDLPYSGVSVGFIWFNLPTTQRRSTVEFNEIRRTMQLLNDGAAVYTLGYQPGTVICNNYIHDVGSHGLYADDHSGHITFENNVVSRAAVHGFQQNRGTYNLVQNNIFYSCGTYALHRNQPTDRPSFTARRNIIVTDRFEKPAFGWYPTLPIEDGQVLIDNSKTYKGIVMDRNLYWDPHVESLRICGMPFKKWQSQTGQDEHSLFADPGFAAPEKGNFNLAPDSPAAKIGFEPIDISTVGPRGKYRAFLGL